MKKGHPDWKAIFFYIFQPRPIKRIAKRSSRTAGKADHKSSLYQYFLQFPHIRRGLKSLPPASGLGLQKNPIPDSWLLPQGKDYIVPLSNKLSPQLHSIRFFIIGLQHNCADLYPLHQFLCGRADKSGQQKLHIPPSPPQ